jgi:hypothetical protein
MSGNFAVMQGQRALRHSLIDKPSERVGAPSKMRRRMTPPLPRCSDRHPKHFITLHWNAGACSVVSALRL